MDFFGIGQAMKGVLDVYFRAARGTGRTTRLVASLKDGDRVIFCNHCEAKRVERMVKQRNLNVEIRVRDPKQIHMEGLGTAQGRTIFDHSFVEKFHMYNLERSIDVLNTIEKEMSGYDERHYETARRAQELMKWDI